MIEILSTPRLSLRSPRQGDRDLLHARIFSDAAVMRYVLGGQPLSPAQSAELFAAHFDHEASGRKLGVLEERASGEVIGFAGLLQCHVLGAQDYEIGFVLARAAWRKGYATEIGHAQLRYGFVTVGCARLLALVSPANAASITALERIGMRLHSTVDTAERGPRRVYVAARDD
jgi:RimJ/RimL family protein N-acetyltransferase